MKFLQKYQLHLWKNGQAKVMFIWKYKESRLDEDNQKIDTGGFTEPYWKTMQYVTPAKTLTPGLPTGYVIQSKTRTKEKGRKRDLPNTAALGKTDTEVQCLQVCN